MVTTGLSRFLQNHGHDVLRETTFWDMGVDTVNDGHDAADCRPTKRARTTLTISDVHSCSPHFPHKTDYQAPVEHPRHAPLVVNVSGSCSQATHALLLRPIKALPLRAANTLSNSSPNPHTSNSPSNRPHQNTQNDSKFVVQPILSKLPPPRYSGDFNLFLTASTLIPSDFSNVSRRHESEFTEALSNDHYWTLCRILSDSGHTVVTSPTPNARCSLPNQSDRIPLSSLNGIHGYVQSDLIRDPASNECLRIGLHDIRETVGGDGPSSSTLRRKGLDVDMMLTEMTSSSSSASTSSPPPVPEPRLCAGACVIGDGSIGDIVDSFGEFVISRVWCGFTDDVDDEGWKDECRPLVELFQGHLALRVFFGDGYVERGHPEVGDHRFEFWAVRSMSGARETE
ncbi:hypothetical protein GGU10DRAFT_350157 [Lentinula aff. detonsa]|uniref:Uncharacterized protein n=1 Tax=Lentinula aff. detonsa TaxID=2804958 RepID=A0AA38KTF3_9AGAR|nr:hypothetical protein GGU10DRAFT_350157 [Lentinula aff. detonsa]